MDDIIRDTIHDISRGQDGVAGPRKKSRPEPARSTTPVKLRLPPSARARLDRQAAQRGQTLAAYVCDLLEEADSRSTPLDGPGHADVTLEQTSRLAHSIHQLPKEVRLARNELARQGGLLKYLVLSDNLALQNRGEIAEAVAELRWYGFRVDRAIQFLLQATAEMRHELSRFASSLPRRGVL